MSNEIQLSEVNYDFCEDLIIDLFDEYHIRIEDDEDRFKSSNPHIAFDDGGENDEISLREIWPAMKDKLSGLAAMMYNFLRTLDAQDLNNAARILRASDGTKRQLVIAILEFLANNLKKTAIGGKDDSSSYRIKPNDE